MKKILIGTLLFIMVYEMSAQNLSRKVEFQVKGENIVLNNDFSIKIVGNNDTIKIIPTLNNTINIPFLFCSQDTFKFFFSYKKYQLQFAKITGSDINFDVNWKFKILNYPYNNDKALLKEIPEEVNEVFIWEFEPEDKDGWLISEPNYNQFPMR